MGWILAALVFGLVFVCLRELLHNGLASSIVTWIALFATAYFIIRKDIQTEASKHFKQGKILVPARKRHLDSGQEEIVTAFTYLHLQANGGDHVIRSATGSRHISTRNVEY